MQKFCFSLLFLCFNLLANAQQSKLIRVGSTLLYRLDVKEKHYDVELLIQQVKPLAFRWQIKDSANASGEVQVTEKGDQYSLYLNAEFVPGNITLPADASSLVLSKNMYKKASRKKNSPFYIKLKPQEETLMQIVSNDVDFSVKVNGKAVLLKQLTLKPVVRMGKKYIVTGDDLVSVYDSRELPLVLKFRSDFYLELLEIRNP